MAEGVARAKVSDPVEAVEEAMWWPEYPTIKT